MMADLDCVKTDKYKCAALVFYAFFFSIFTYVVIEQLQVPAHVYSMRFFSTHDTLP